MERRGRIALIFLLLSAGFAAVTGRLLYLQVVRSGDLTARAERQQESVITIEPKRGTIYDRMGRELAVSVDADSIYGVPSAVRDPRALAQRLARILPEDARTLERRLDSGRSFVWLSRKVDPQRVERVKALGLRKEIGFLRESQRFYPKKTLAGALLGFTGVDNEGLEGVERQYDESLRGTQGRLIAEKDAYGRMVFPGGPGFAFTLPKPGKDLVLTIDEVVQHIADKELDRALAASRARGGVSIVMQPRTGEVIALSVRAGGQPPFNPNMPKRSRPEQWRNRAVTDSFEPGSIFKPVLAAAALEEKIVQPHDRLDCSGGSIKIADRVIRDAHRNGVLSFADVIAESSNVGTIKVSLRLGKERFHRYIEAFGFGKKTGVDLPGEAPGMVKDHPEWSGVSIGSIAIGQEIGVTPMQMAAAFSVIANGGTLMRPAVVSEIVDPDGREGRRFRPAAAGRIISEETAAKLRKILQRVVESGTGQRAKPTGYTAAGKTGTAQKVDAETGRYSVKEYLSSFVGFVPAGDPQLVILVMIDSPVGSVYGGTVAAPVFRAVAEQSLAYLQVPPDDTGGRMLLVRQ